MEPKRFAGNSRLKQTGQRLNWTEQEGIEFAKCADDYLYFIETYIKFLTLDKGLTNVTLYPFQKDVLDTYHNERFVIFKCPRQSGKSSTTIGYLLWFVLFNKDKEVGILAQKEATAIELLHRIKLAYENLPMFLQQGVEEWNKKSIYLENGSKIMAESTSSGALRGFTLSLVYLDEFAMVPTNIAEDFFTSVYPTITSGQSSKIIITSTPLGLNLFYRFWQDANKEHKDPANWNHFKAIEVHWSQVPGRTQQWADMQKKIMGETKYAQDIECEFLGSAGTLISGRKLRELVFQKPLKNFFDEKLSVYAEPDPSHIYVLAADPSEGTGLDYSTFTIFDVATVPYEIVGRFRCNQVDATLFPSYISMTAQHYNDAYVIVENNSIGALVCDTLLHDLEYDNMFFSFTNEHTEMTATQHGKAKIPGLRTTKKTKMQGCNKLKTLVETDQIKINDFEAVHELSTFVLQTNKSYAAEEGYHDDVVANLWLFAWLTAQPVFKDVSDVNIRARIYADRLRQMEEQMPARPIIQDQKNQKVPDNMFVADGCLFIDASLDYNDSLRSLHGGVHDIEPLYDDAFERLYGKRN